MHCPTGPASTQRLFPYSICGPGFGNSKFENSCDLHWLISPMNMFGYSSGKPSPPSVISTWAQFIYISRNPVTVNHVLFERSKLELISGDNVLCLPCKNGASTRCARRYPELKCLVTRCKLVLNCTPRTVPNERLESPESFPEVVRYRYLATATVMCSHSSHIDSISHQ